MTTTSTDPALIAVWVSMADHFLDTETRHDLPLTALRCVEAGLSPADARAIWQHDVSPAVGFNLFDVAGEWACWDRDWLIATIESVRKSRWHRPGMWRAMRWPMPLMGGQWLAIERCIDFLQALPSPRIRQRTANDLAFLARHWFDVSGPALSGLPEEERRGIRRLYPALFGFLLGSALSARERKGAERRMQLALSEVAA